MARRAPEEDEPSVDNKVSFSLKHDDGEAENHHADDTLAHKNQNKKAGKKNRRRQRHNQRSIIHSPSVSIISEGDEMTPSQRIQSILDEIDESDLEFHPVFSELFKLHKNTYSHEFEWKEAARWVKFEEDVEEGGNRWSKPHVATLSLHSLVALRQAMAKGTVILDMYAEDFATMIDITLEKLEAADQLKEHDTDRVRELLMKRHLHQHDHDDSKPKHKMLDRVRDLKESGRNLSSRMLHSHSHGKQLEVPDSLGVGHPSGGDLHHSASSANLHFKKKLPPGTESNTVFAGTVDFLDSFLCCFVRLKNAFVMEHLSEVEIPTRFMFILLGPESESKQIFEMGRSMATLMTDEVFRDIAYAASNTGHLLDAVDEFLDQVPFNHVTVLPPGEWDPSIRIEPPTHVQSQVSRLKHSSSTHDSESSKGGPATNGDVMNGVIDALASEDPGEARDADPVLKRTGILFGGLWKDIRRKVPWYPSDFKDAFHPQCIAAVIFMYFACLAPIVTFGGLLGQATGNSMAAMENLLAGAVCGVTYHLFSGQPLTVIGSTGPVLVFETIVVNLCTTLGIDYLAFRCVVNIWTGVILLIAVATDASSLVSFITRFTEESFATLIALIFMFEAFKKVFGILTAPEYAYWGQYQPPLMPNPTSCDCLPPTSPVDNVPVWFEAIRDEQFHKIPIPELYNHSWLVSVSTVTAINYDQLPLDYCTMLAGSLTGNTCYKLDDVFLMSLVLMLGTFFVAQTLRGVKTGRFFPTTVRRYISDFAVIVAIFLMTIIDLIANYQTPKLHVPEEFHPTDFKNRDWFISPFNNPWWTWVLGVLPAILACILIFMDQQITAVIVNRKEHKLKKSCGYHLDLLVVALQIIGCGFFGLPIYVAATVLSITHVNALKVESETSAPGEVPSFVGVREQRLTGVITFILIGASMFMSPVLSLIPMPVLYGVFLYMGVNALNSQLWDRFLLYFMPMKWQPDYMFLRKVPIGKVHLFTLFQVVCLAFLWAIKSIKATAILFPIMLVVMIGIRKLMEKVFSPEILEALDDEMPEIHLRKKADAKKHKEKKEKDHHHPSSHKFGFPWSKSSAKLHPVATESHLHIPMASGNVMSIPLSNASTLAPLDNVQEEDEEGLMMHNANGVKNNGEVKFHQ